MRFTTEKEEEKEDEGGKKKTWNTGPVTHMVVTSINARVDLPLPHYFLRRHVEYSGVVDLK